MVTLWIQTLPHFPILLFSFLFLFLHPLFVSLENHFQDSLSLKVSFSLVIPLVPSLLVNFFFFGTFFGGLSVTVIELCPAELSCFFLSVLSFFTSFVSLALSVPTFSTKIKSSSSLISSIWKTWAPFFFQCQRKDFPVAWLFEPLASGLHDVLEVPPWFDEQGHPFVAWVEYTDTNFGFFNLGNERVFRINALHWNS